MINIFILLCSTNIFTLKTMILIRILCSLLSYKSYNIIKLSEIIKKLLFSEQKTAQSLAKHEFSIIHFNVILRLIVLEI